MRTMDTIRALVAKARQGDSAAFGQLYDTYLDDIYRFVFFRVNRREDAEDISEAVFVSAFEHINEYQEQGIPFAAWLYRIARNKLIDHYRQHKPQVSIDEAIDVPDHMKSPEHETEIALTKDLVMDGIRKLPEAYQEIIILKYIDEKENEEISELLDKPVAHVRVLQSRALARLRSVLGI